MERFLIDSRSNAAKPVSRASSQAREERFSEVFIRQGFDGERSHRYCRRHHG
jgi:hypothetical protein